MTDRRLKACVAQWPDCQEGSYDPSCCRFPKSCSCTVYSDSTPDEALEPREVDSGFTGGVRPTLPCGHDEEEHMAVVDREVWCAECDKEVVELAETDLNGHLINPPALPAYDKRPLRRRVR